MVRDGEIKRNAQVRLLRDSVEIWKGKIQNLKRFKDDASEVRSGMECGIDLGQRDIRAGDMIEAFATEKMAAELGGNVADMKAAAAKAAAMAEAEQPVEATA